METFAALNKAGSDYNPSLLRLWPCLRCDMISIQFALPLNQTAPSVFSCRSLVDTGERDFNQSHQIFMTLKHYKSSPDELAAMEAAVAFRASSRQSFAIITNR